MSSFDFVNVCRLCLTKDGSFQPIFGGENEHISLKITSCLPVKVTREDKLPQKICDQCCYKLDMCYAFWNQTVETEKQLLQWLSNVDTQNYAVTTILNQDIMKGGQSNENRLDGSVMQQVSGHQNSMNMGIDNMCISMIMPNNNQQQITSVPIDTSGSSVQNVQVIAGSSTQTTHDQIMQSQTNAPTQQEEEEESSEDEENSDDECDGDEGLPIKEESEEDPNNSRTIEPTTFVNVSLHCDEAGPSGIRQQKMTDIQEMAQATDVDPKTGEPLVDLLYISDSNILNDPLTDPLNVPDANYLEHSSVENIIGSVLHKRKRRRKRKTEIGVRRKKHYYMKQEIKRQSVKQKKINKPVINNKRPKSSLKCNTCDKHFRKEFSMTRHMNARKYPCHRCCQVFCRKKALKNHAASVHEYFMYSCNICEYKTKTKRDLTSHFIRKHSEIWQTSSKKQLRIQHNQEQCTNQVRNNVRSTICTICGHVCKNIRAIQAHMKQQHYKPQFVCRICKRGMSTQKTFEQHLKWHETRAYALCPICRKKYRSRNIKNHMQTHNKVKPYSCPVCDKMFRQQSTQDQHILLTHTGKRPYICNICDLAFSQKRYLIIHRKKHPEPLPPLPVVPLRSIIAEFTKEYLKKQAVVKKMNEKCTTKKNGL